MIEWLWAHQGVNSGMIGNALWAGGLDKMARDRDWLDFMVRAVSESLAVVSARGVDLKSYPETDPFVNADRKETVGSFYHLLNETDRGRRTVGQDISTTTAGR